MQGPGEKSHHFEEESSPGGANTPPGASHDVGAKAGAGEELGPQRRGEALGEGPGLVRACQAPLTLPRHPGTCGAGS